jgi:hypothetical protein
MQDLPAIRRACQPIARWWDDYLRTGNADPDRLDQSLVDARALGPLSGRLGDALAYIIAGCLPNLNYTDAAAAFDRVAAIGRGANIDALDAIGATSPTAALEPADGACEQLAFPSMTAAPPPTRDNLIAPS